MAVVMIMQWTGLTPQQYDDVRRVVNWEGQPPTGALHHVAAFDASGLRVTDVWESAESFQAFVDQRLMPGVKEVGLTTEPKVEIYPTHAIFAPGYTPRA